MRRTPKSDAESLAELYAQARTKLTFASKALHDDVGPLVSASGLKLQLLRDDVPAIAAEVNDVLGILEEAVERVRRVSQEVNPMPAARLGLKIALESLEILDDAVSVDCVASGNPPELVVAALYEAAAAAVNAALAAGADQITVAATGSGSIAIRIADNGRRTGRARALSVATLLARESGLRVTLTTGKSTIVWIKYAVRRTSRR